MPKQGLAVWLLSLQPCSKRPLQFTPDECSTSKGRLKSAVHVSSGLPFQFEA